VCLTSVCLSDTSGLIREKTKIDTEVAHVRHDSDKIFKDKGQGHQAAHRRVGASGGCSVGVRTCWPWETAATLRLPSVRRRKALRHPREEERGRGISWRPPAYSLL